MFVELIETEQPVLYKKCCKCKEEKPLTSEYFSRQSRFKDGFKRQCKVCIKTYYTKTGFEPSLTKTHKVCTKCQQELPVDCFRKDSHKTDGYTSACRVCKGKQDKEWSDRTKEERNATKWWMDDDYKRKRNTYQRRRKQEDPLFDLANRIRGNVTQTLRKMNQRKTHRTLEYVGCDVVFLAKHLESQFSEGMSWENRHLWQIDHKVCISSAETLEDVVRLNHYSNLQPLWAIENIIKFNMPYEDWLVLRETEDYKKKVSAWLVKNGVVTSSTLS